MPRRLRTIPGPSRLSGILAHLTKQPRLELNAELKKLKVSYKFKNGDFGARCAVCPLLLLCFLPVCSWIRAFFVKILDLFARIYLWTCVGRYFVKEELPRIRYANPDLEIEVDKLNPSNPSHRTRDPSMVLEFSEHQPFLACANLIQLTQRTPLPKSSPSLKNGLPKL